jgi:TonB family protein
VSLAVDRIIERRSRPSGRRPEAVSLAAAALLHGLAVALILFLPRMTPPPPPLSFVPVTIIPAQALGVRRPASRPKAKKPAPEPAKEPERPAPEPEKPEPEREDVPVLPTEKKPEKKPEPPKPSTATDGPRRPPEKTPEKPEPKPPASSGTGTNPAGTAAQGTPDGEAGRRGSATGNPLGTSAFGSAIAGLDNPDFRFGYYLDQLLSAIDSKWVRPPLGEGVEATISFRIQRNGSLSDLQVAVSSGYNSFDLAALRAVQNASPFPPLPRAYRNDSLGVNLIVR